MKKAVTFTTGYIIAALIAILLLVIGINFLTKTREAGTTAIKTFVPDTYCKETHTYYGEYEDQITSAHNQNQNTLAEQLKKEAIACFPDKKTEIEKHSRTT
jgi:uncharacterized membrane protein (Fun14 family)